MRKTITSGKHTGLPVSPLLNGLIKYSNPLLAGQSGTRLFTYYELIHISQQETSLHIAFIIGFLTHQPTNFVLPKLIPSLVQFSIVY